MCEWFHRAKVTVVPSSSDANPQVISESIASNTPVACAEDITGGSFQINRMTGMLFKPDGQSLAGTIIEMLKNQKTFQPARFGVQWEDCLNQMESLLYISKLENTDS